jgi:hypothetical protein
MGMKGRINVGLVLIGIRSVFDIAYKRLDEPKFNCPERHLS